jgi:hypothetical protein
MFNEDTTWTTLRGYSAQTLAYIAEHTSGLWLKEAAVHVSTSLNKEL